MEANAGSFARTDPWLEDNEFSETAKFINQILMEDNVDQSPFYDPLSLQVTENSFYQALNGNLPDSPNQHPLVHSPGGETTTATTSNHNIVLQQNFGQLKLPFPDSAFQSNPQALSQPPSITVSDGFSNWDFSTAELMPQNLFNVSDYDSQFRRGLEEASIFLPPQPNLVTAPYSNREQPHNAHAVKGRKNHERQEEEEGRSNKQSALSLADETDLSDAFDRTELLREEIVCICNEQSGGKAPPKKQVRKREKETVDLMNLLLLCAQSVNHNDIRTSNELLKKIRQHSSPIGNASQRLAHYFANGLEARLLGDATSAAGRLFLVMNSNRYTTAEFLQAYQVFLSVTPFIKFTYFFANKMIMEAAAKAETLHVIEFGILYGFQWPMLIKLLSNREGGPPKLRFTGIEFPQPGFRPTQKIEETGRHLANYCKRYNVPFEFNAIASKNWGTIQLEALKIEKNELVAVNSSRRLENVLDETYDVNSPRNAVLHLIRMINPDIFTHSISNASYSSPFFTSRFKEVLLHFSAIYDVCDTVIPRENEWRMMIERELFAREAMNVIACEGSQRIEMPETYKKWHIRHTRAGFKQLPLNEEIMAKCRSELREWYHRDFFLDEDSNWMLQGWKGRVLHASTCLVPA
ncbi:hypothetical protein Fmac_022193 [Flemingia macrophylla]|uniref:Scarecrow-like protein 14 n=1 Tax=Flemingia macrophylla TaxID=520843 RepID=A0ABD1LZ11_9FABA